MFDSQLLRSTLLKVREKSRFVDRAVYFARLHARVAGSNPVAVYNMAKVGSSTLAKMITTGTGRSTIHCHWTTKAGVKAAAGWWNEHGVSRPGHRSTGDYFRYRLALNPRRQWDIVCGVRDPIARDVSLGFQVGPEFGFFEGAGADDDELVNQLTAHIVELGTRDYISSLDWFDVELREVTGIDVYATPFDRSAGYQIYENGRFRVLLIRFEDLGRVASEALGSFFAVPNPPLETTNVGDDKAYAELYSRFKADARFPESALDRAYASRLAQHFYSQEELDGFRARWLGRKTTPS